MTVKMFDCKRSSQQRRAAAQLAGRAAQTGVTPNPHQHQEPTHPLQRKDNSQAQGQRQQRQQAAEGLWLQARAAVWTLPACLSLWHTDHGIQQQLPQRAEHPLTKLQCWMPFTRRVNQSAELRDPASQPNTSRLSFVRNSTRVTNDTRCSRHPDLIAWCHFFRGTFPLPDLVNPQHSVASSPIGHPRSKLPASATPWCRIQKTHYRCKSNTAGKAPVGISLG